jgi:hypothetical protein
MMRVPEKPRRRRIWLISIGIVLILLVAGGAWLATRVLVAKDGLESAAETASRIPELIRSGDTAGAMSAARDFEVDASSARSATSDPIWRAAEWIPVIGADLTAVRGMSDVAVELAKGAVTPLAENFGNVDISSLGFVDGRIDVAPLAAAAPTLAAANTALREAVARVDALPNPSLKPVQDARERLRTLTNETAAVIDGLDRAAAIFPAMVGADGPRTYLLLVLNNAEIRTYGGIAGAGAVLRFDDGRVSIERQFSSSDFKKSPTPVIDLSSGTTALFDDHPARFIQNTTSSLDFTESAAAATALWERQTGDRVDGVIAIDAVTISYLLEATGPVQAGPFSLDASNAVNVLLSDVYAQILDTSMQDEAFALVARGVFETLAAGKADVGVLMSSLGKAVAEQRLHVWSAHPEEEARITGTGIATILPPDDDGPRVGVFFNDVTGAKLDYYATPSTTVLLDECGATPRATVTVDWTNTIPADAATSLPDYVIGPELTVAARGETLTRVAVAGPTGWLATDYSFDGGEIGVQTAQFEDRTAIQHEFVTAPGGSHRIVVQFSAPEGTSLAKMPLEVVSTPLVHPNDVTITRETCDR